MTWDLPTQPCPGVGLVLVTGASGYIGGRLVGELVARGYRVRAMVRSPEAVVRDDWPGVEVVAADAMDPGSLAPALDGVAVAYYLIHSMVLGPLEFAVADISSARNFRSAAEAAGVGRIIYLGGLGPSETILSRHLASRQQVAEELSAGSIPCTILRASIIIGSGSASFEIIKHLVLRLPVIPVPRWGRNLSQPISIRDVLKYLVGILEVPQSGDRTYDIGGLEVMTYAQMMSVLAELLGKRRRFVTVPFGGPRVVGYLVSLLTPVPAPITLCLMGGLRHDTICSKNAIQFEVPFTPIPYREALIRALGREQQDHVATRWSDAYPPAHELAPQLHQLRRPPRYSARHELLTDRPASDLFAAITRIGGREGWFEANWMWRLRGAFDRVIFGVGTARGRRSSRGLRVGDVIDFWRVEDLQPDRRLLLRAEMRMPGRAWLEFTVDESGGRRRLAIAAYYATRSVWGRLYWRAFQPFHWYIFAGLLRQIEQRSLSPGPRQGSASPG
ncbi:MAG: DUF2867 domain-containing protein [Gemmatimonas sp.]|nr:DUF2867 domain-containing protein [Gemmatimonas sp.]